MFLVNGRLSRHCGTLCPSEVISLVGILILSQAKKTITFISGKKCHPLLQTQICMNRFSLKFFQVCARWERSRGENIRGDRYISQCKDMKLNSIGFRKNTVKTAVRKAL